MFEYDESQTPTRAEWTNPVVDGTWPARVDRARECERHPRCLQVTFRFDGPDAAPDGPALVDLHAKPGWQLAAVVAAFKLPRAGSLDPATLAGRPCRATVGHWTGDDEKERAEIRKVFAVPGSEVAPAASPPPATGPIADEELPF